VSRRDTWTRAARAVAGKVIVICYGCAGSRTEPDGRTPCRRCGGSGIDPNPN
jgi:hypothetical protein